MRLTLPFLGSRRAGQKDAGQRSAGKKRGAKQSIARESRKATKRRARARWLGPTLRFGAPVALAGIVGASGYFVWSSGQIQAASQAAMRAAVNATVEAGLSVQHVSVVGRRETGRETLLKALNVGIGDPILTVDLGAALERVRDIGWVQDAAIERRLPDRLHVHLKERVAAAIWQRDGGFVLIDHSGAIIGEEGMDRHRRLKVVVGEGAPEKAAHLLAALATEPSLEERVIAAVWVGGRRWNLRLENGVDIRLPEDDLPGAWARLAQLERDHKLLTRDIEAIDLRQSDQFIVRLTEDAAEKRRTRKDET